MPIVTLVCNIQASRITNDFRKEFTKLMAATLKKPEEGLALHIQADSLCSLGIADPHAPVAIVNVKAIGHLSEEENEGHVAKITEFLQTHLGVQPPRVLIHFEDLKAHMVAKSGITVKKMLGAKK